VIVVVEVILAEELGASITSHGEVVELVASLLAAVVAHVRQLHGEQVFLQIKIL